MHLVFLMRQWVHVLHVGSLDCEESSLARLFPGRALRLPGSRVRFNGFEDPEGAAASSIIAGIS